jgi:hypothetical protein
MIVKSFGCSFIYGSDLADVTDGGEPYFPPSKSTWPALLAQHLGYEYQCYARPGSGNLRILEKILTHASNATPEDLFVIGWTWIDRFDYTVDSSDQSHVYDLAGNNLWRTVMPVDSDNRAHAYYRDLHSQFVSKLTSLTYVKLTIDTLQQKNIPFIMTYMDELLFETEWHITPAVTGLQDYVRSYLTKFENKTFLEYTKEKGFPISETLHPLEEAHQAAFELIRPSLDAIQHRA